MVFLHTIYKARRSAVGCIAKREAFLESPACADLLYIPIRDREECLFLSQSVVLTLTFLSGLSLQFILFSFFPHTEEMVEGKSAILIGMSQWNSNDLVEQIETIGKLEENQGNV